MRSGLLEEVQLGWRVRAAKSPSRLQKIRALLFGRWGLVSSASPPSFIPVELTAQFLHLLTGFSRKSAPENLRPIAAARAAYD